MVSKKELQIAYGLAIYFLFVGVLSYAVFSAERPETPVRMMFKSTAGKVLFDHKTHIDDAGYGLACTDCHHHPLDETEGLLACGECHAKSKSEVLPESCNNCHEPDEIEETEMLKRGDAFHGQCIGCHEAFSAGPIDCAECHVM